MSDQFSLQIPKDLLVEVFLHLKSEKDLVCCCLVTKKWNGVIATNPQIWKVLCLRKWQINEKEVELCVKSWKRAAFFVDAATFRETMERISNSILQDKKDMALYLDARNLSILPTDLFTNYFSFNLCYLELSRNSLETLPSNFGNLTNLRTLYLDRNRLQEIPDSFGKLTKLGSLDLKDNKLTQMPLSLLHLTNLRSLRLYGNEITFISSHFTVLTKLKDCHLDKDLTWPKPNKDKN